MPRQGSLWVEFNYVHFIDSSEDEWRFLGDLVGTPSGARVGSIWLEGDYWHYIDSNGEERRMPGIFFQDHSSGPGRVGSIWLEDTEHTDGTIHNDTPHGDLPARSHTDQIYGTTPGSHNDVSNRFHQDYPHYNQAHVNTTPSNAWTKPLLHYIEEGEDERGAHLDVTTNQGHANHNDSSAWHVDWGNDYNDHSNSHTNHTDVNSGGHTDVPHTDSPVGQSFTDIHHNEWIGSEYSDFTDFTDYTDTPPYQDTTPHYNHGDTSHSNTAHYDQGYSVPHVDSGHGDGHTDWPAEV